MESQSQDSVTGQGESSKDRELRQMVRQELSALKGRSASGAGQSTSQGSMGRGGQSGQSAGGTSSPRDNPSGSTAGSSSNSGSGSQSSASSVGQSSSGHRNKKAKVEPKMNANNSQTVAQVLTQAQYELSQELEANLKKLRSVIQQSEEIAKKIELVLGRGEQGSGTKE